MNFSKETIEEVTSEDFNPDPSSQTSFLETSDVPVEQATGWGDTQKASAYTIGFRVVVGLFLAALLFVAAIYYGLINP
jgi:hypothetical protein